MSLAAITIISATPTRVYADEGASIISEAEPEAPVVIEDSPATEESITPTEESSQAATELTSEESSRDGPTDTGAINSSTDISSTEDAITNATTDINTDTTEEIEKPKPSVKLPEDIIINKGDEVIISAEVVSTEQYKLEFSGAEQIDTAKARFIASEVGVYL